jgi:hypothetical protein
MENMSKSRSIPCIALYPCCNATGSWEFMSLKSKTRVRRSQWQPMVTTQAVIDAMNAFNEEPVAVVAEPAINVGALVLSTPIMESVPEVPVPVPVDTDVGILEPVGAEESPGVEPSVVLENLGQGEQPAALGEEEDPTMPELVAQDLAEAESDDEAEEEEEEEIPPPRRSTRIVGGVF